MSAKNLMKRIKKVEKAAQNRDQFSCDCTCFPKNEQPRFVFPVMQQVAFNCKCRVHGDTFQPRGVIYTSKWERDKQSQGVALFHSSQYVKAWNAAFPADQWPAEEITIDGRIHLRLKEGTILTAEGDLPKQHDRARFSSIEYIGNRLQKSYLWSPRSKAQRQALDCPADLLLIGGAAGSLKTTTLLVDGIQEYDNPNLNFYFFRRTYPEMEDTIAKAWELYSEMGATFNDTKKLMRFPSGAKVHFRHADCEKDVRRSQSKEMSVIALDESTHFEEDLVRYLITRNRSTDPSLKVRVRLGTNPGNIGNTWHMAVFFNGVCPHCTPEWAPPQGVPFVGATWSDGVPIEGLSVAYVLSNITDHDLFDKKYIERLRMQNLATKKALLEGCWNVPEGQFFDIFEPQREGMPMVVPLAHIGVEPWWPRWVSADYGFSISIAAAHLFVHEPPSDRFPDGRTYIVAEMGDKITPAEFARRIVKEWVTHRWNRGGEWRPFFLSPDAFADRGNSSLTQAGQMNAVLRPYNLSFVKANDARAAGATLIYAGLRTGQLVIAAECPRTIQAIKTRMRDPKTDCDVKKVPGDPLDDFYDSARYGYYSYDSFSRENNVPRNVVAERKYTEQYQQNPQMALTTAALRYGQDQGENQESLQFYSPTMLMRRAIKRSLRC